jgi:hypothetical protein
VTGKNVITVNRKALLAAVKTPLSFFVLGVLVVEAVFSVFYAKAADATLQKFLVNWMGGLLLLMILVVAAISYFRPRNLYAVSNEPVTGVAAISILIGPPENLPNFDISRIDWKFTECFLLAANRRHTIKLVPSRIGSSYRVQLDGDVQKLIKPNESIEMELKDQKGNRWMVKSFFPLETLVPLTAVEKKEKLIADYSDENE